MVLIQKGHLAVWDYPLATLVHAIELLSEG